MVVMGWAVRSTWYAIATAVLSALLGVTSGGAAWASHIHGHGDATAHGDANGSLTAPLLGAHSPGDGGDGTTIKSKKTSDQHDKPTRQQSWWSLIGKAISFVWPKTWGHQLRLVVCLLILLIVRVLNLALPLANKHMIDRLSEVCLGGWVVGGVWCVVIEHIEMVNTLQLIISIMISKMLMMICM